MPLIIPRNVLAGPEAPSNKLHIAGIGIGGMGRNNMRACKNEQVTALCDVDHRHAAGCMKDFPEAKKYFDFRELLANENEVDAVVIASPDHTHADISLAAMKAGKHVFCQKPLTHDIFESRVLAEAAAKYDVVTQMGIQGHSQDGIRLITEWIADGAIGEVTEVDSWCSLMYSPPGHAWWSSPLQKRPAEGQKLPEGLDWENWIGSAEMRPYHSCYHPAKWRCWWDFGCGMMGDRGAHTLDPVKTALKLGDPISVHGSDIVGGNVDVHPDQAKIVFKFAARDGFPALTLNWYEGQEPPRPEGLEEGRKFPREGGSLFKGTKGMLWCGVYGGSPRLLPEDAMKRYTRPKATLPRVRTSHEGDWIQAIKNGKKAGADFSYSGPLTEMALLGNLGKKFPGKELQWDAENLQVRNHDAANAWVRRPRRSGWELNV